MATVYFDLPNVTNGSGTSASPKNQTGWNAYSPAAGDILLFKRGTTSAANAFTLTAGTVGNRIKWGAWFNADGTDDSTKAKPIITTTTVLSTAASTNKDYVFLDNISVIASAITVANDKGLLFLGTGATMSNCTLSANIGCCYVSDASTVIITDNTMTGVSHSTANTNYVLFVTGTAVMSSITIDGNTILHSGGGSNTSHCIKLQNTDAANTLTGLTFSNNTVTTSTGSPNANKGAFGMRIFRTASAIYDNNTITNFQDGMFVLNCACTIKNSTLTNNYHFGLHCSTDAIGCTIENNTCSYNGTSTNDGVDLFAYGRGMELSGAAGQARCGGHTIRFNTCNNNYNYGGPLDNGSEGVGIGLDDATNNCLVYGNTCKNNEGNGIQCYGGTLGSGSPAITDTGNHRIIANYLSNNCTAAITNRRSGGTDTNAFNADISLATIVGTTSYIAHNVCNGSTPTGININAACDGKLIIANNIFTNTHGIGMDSTYSASIGVCNSNNFYNVSQTYSLRTVNASGSVTFAVNSYVGTNNLSANPKWTDDYHLSTGSALISAGFAIGSRLDFGGRTYNPAPSVGMWEWFDVAPAKNPPGGNMRRRIFHRR